MLLLIISIRYSTVQLLLKIGTSRVLKVTNKAALYNCNQGLFLQLLQSNPISNLLEKLCFSLLRGGLSATHIIFTLAQVSICK